MPVVVENLELAAAPAPETPPANAQPDAPPPPTEPLDAVLQRLEERAARVWAH
jgi:hypothetical protein